MHGKLMEEGSHERQAKMPRQSRRCVSPLAGESGRSKGKKVGMGVADWGMRMSTRIA
jgi:hypothetical protein